MKNKFVFRLLGLLVVLLFFYSFKKGGVVNENSIQVIYKLKGNNSTKFKVDNIEFELLFDINSALFRLVDKVVDESDRNYKITSIIHGGNLVYYTNKTVKESIYNVSLNEQIFNVKQDYNRLDWKITTETKIINGFKCFKATTTFERNDKSKNTIIKYTPEVWFTSEIPTSFGPKGLNGLPGLILEGTMDGKTYFFATNINREYKLKNGIERPKANTEISENDFDNLIFENYKKIKEIQNNIKN